MGRKYDYDYIIIGSGPAGRTAAYELAKAKKHVALVEESNFGGSELTTRDIPAFISLDFANNYNKLASHPAIKGQDIHYNLPTIASHSEHIATTISEYYKHELENLNVTLLPGHAHFLDPHTISVGTNQYTASNFILATGSKLKFTGISGLDTVNFLTPSTAFRIRRLPKFVFVVGAGPTGCEIAEYYAKLGTKVIIMELATHLLPREDKEVSTTLEEYYQTELDITPITSAKVISITQDDTSKIVIFTTGGQEKMVRVDCIILATGYESITDYGLENANVTYKRTGIIVNKEFQTSTKHIYAIGDAIGTTDSSTDLSVYQARLLTANLLRRTKTPPSYAGFIRDIHTTPEVAIIGLNEHDITARDLKCKRSTVFFKDLPCGIIYDSPYGFVKLLANTSGHLIGATIMAPNASALIQELSLALRQHIAISSIVATPHITNSYSETIKLAAKKLL